MEKLAKKKTRQPRRSSNDKSNKIEQESDDVNFGDNITYDVLRMILEYSNIKDLTRAAMVCRSWNEAAKKEVQTRLKPQHILHEFESKKKKHHDSKNFANQLFIKPSIGLLFLGKLAKTNIWQSDSHVAHGCLCDHLPQETDCITVSNYGLVHDNVEMAGDVVAGLFLPEIAGVKIRCFSMSQPDVEQFKTTRQRYQGKLAREFCKIAPNEENIKCVILFANEDSEYLTEGYQILKSFLSYRTNEIDNSIAIWGGVSSKLTVCMCTSNKKTCMKTAPLAGISICGTGVSAWSIVLDSCIKTKEQVEKELTVFSNAVKLQKYTVGFMFACCGRGEEWYSEKNVEPNIFRKLFPNVPLVGSFGGGEFGLSTISQEHSEEAAIVHEYSTIFLILSYGSVRKTK